MKAIADVRRCPMVRQQAFVGIDGGGDESQERFHMLQYAPQEVIAKPGETGLKIAQKDSVTAFPGKYFRDGSGAITVTIAAGEATTEGNFRVFCEYSVIQ